ncbi:MAG: 50S ribosomal protein L17 [Calditrichaeota bacterium]|nr:50S ribosomal protein L17 [Calditrichota bacterium]
MRHGVRGRKLGRTHAHRKALLNNLVQNLVINKRIKTTDEKAKEASALFDRLVSFGKKNDLSARREAFRYLKNRDLVKILFENIAPELADRNGGYTTIHKTGVRKGDGAQLSLLQIVGFEKFLKTEEAAKTEETE